MRYAAALCCWLISSGKKCRVCAGEKKSIKRRYVTSLKEPQVYMLLNHLDNKRNVKCVHLTSRLSASGVLSTGTETEPYQATLVCPNTPFKVFAGGNLLVSQYNCTHTQAHTPLGTFPNQNEVERNHQHTCAHHATFATQSNLQKVPQAQDWTRVHPPNHEIKIAAAR